MQEHDHLDDLSIALKGAVGANRDLATILKIRSDLSLLLETHLAREDRFLYEPLLEREADDLARAVDAFHRTFAELATDWADYLRGWDPDAIASDPEGFAGETLHIVARLRARIAEENRLLYPRALIEGHIRLRAARAV